MVDFQSFTQGDNTAQQAIAQQIYQACYNFGFVYLKNHGISQAQIDSVLAQSQCFFNLPLEIKNQIRRSPLTNCGYVPLQSEHLNPHRPGDLKEAFNVGNQTIWLAEQEEFRQVVWQFYQDAISVAFTVLKAFAMALKLPESFFADNHGQNFFLRLLHYPPLAATVAAQQIRAGEHTDYGTITLLFQDGVGGLEICTRQAEWLAAPALPGTVLVNVGDAMQRWTNDHLRSTPHRVMNPPEEQRNRSRYSIALFCDPNPDVEIRCLESCQSLEDPPRYPPIRYAEYLQSKFAATY